MNLKEIAKPFEEIFLKSEKLSIFLKEMNAQGFVRKFSTGWALLSEKKDIVIKIGFLLEPGYKSKYCIPSYINWNIVQKNNRGRWFRYPNQSFFIVQPFADTSPAAQLRAYHYLSGKIRKDIDFHSDNVAEYRGRAVLIDW